MIKLISIKPSTNKNKKLKATFLINGDTIKNIHFGDKRYDDFTTHKDEKRKELYIKRHKSREDWNNPLSAGTLSRYLLWEDKILLTAIEKFKKKFNL